MGRKTATQSVSRCVCTVALQRPFADINQRAADMWSYAVLLWELATREVPFADLSPMEVGMKVCSTCSCGGEHRHRIDKYLATLLASQTARKALPPTIAESGNRKMADCRSFINYLGSDWLCWSRMSEITKDVSSAVT